MRARHFVGGGVLAVAAALGAATAASAAGNPVVIQPNAVTPGSQFTVFDGGNCDSSGGTARFSSREHAGEDIPAVQLGSLRGLVGAVATVPEQARPGVYQVSIQCKTVTESQLTATFTVSPSGKPDGKSDSKSDGKPDGTSDGRPELPGGSGSSGSSGGAQSGEFGEPKGPTHAGLGGSTGPNLPETLAGATLLTTAAAATVLHLRHRRGSAS
ncbi:hypothetical protein P3T36_003114 [Kitasatospora sp. MAP12-15]|uniref:hypothetical protein n=1 Tax=unclassified Kitasatospora TaxID=2633591 RepID=UPI002473A1B4|nr:hypothetical protein [Kitasatospora sp. MAP12-44]MDH6110745.1 hypothetical protein [Kitasatospora sp. MAP12-44]